MKLTIRERLCYGCGDLGSQFAYNLVTTYLMIFFTDILGLSSVAAGTIFLIATAFDAINDPLMGSIADHTKTKHGSYRPYMMAAAIPYGIFLALCFVAPEWSYSGKLAWAYVMYLLYVIFSTMFQMPYGSLSNVMTDDLKERTMLGAFRDWGANLAGFLLNMFAVTIITHFSASDQNMDKRGCLLRIIHVSCCLGDEGKDQTAEEHGKAHREFEIHRTKQTGPLYSVHGVFHQFFRCIPKYVHYLLCALLFGRREYDSNDPDYHVYFTITWPALCPQTD